MKTTAKDLSLNIAAAYVHNNYTSIIIKAFLKIEVP